QIAFQNFRLLGIRYRRRAIRLAGASSLKRDFSGDGRVLRPRSMSPPADQIRATIKTEQVNRRDVDSSTCPAANLEKVQVRRPHPPSGKDAYSFVHEPFDRRWLHEMFRRVHKFL